MNALAKVQANRIFINQHTSTPLLESGVLTLSGFLLQYSDELNVHVSVLSYTKDFHTGRCPIPGQLFARAVGTVQTIYRGPGTRGN